MRQLINVLLLIMTFGGCTSLKQGVVSMAAKTGIVEHVTTQAPAEAPQEYRRALLQMQEGKFQEAYDILSVYVQQNPTAAYTQSSELNMGRALEGLGRFSDAVTQYRKVAIATATVAPKLQAMALYRLSFCDEALGDDQQTVAVLHDLEGRAKFMSPEIVRAELPARLAAAYARVGNFSRAIEEYKKAENGINQLKRASQAQGGVPEWLPKTLYFMGSLAARHVGWTDFETALRPLARGQSYSLDASDLAIDPWSERASKDLISTYQDLWNAIQSAPLLSGADPLLEQRAVQEAKWTRATLLLESIKNLRVHKAPIATQTPQSQRIFDYLTILEGEISHILDERPAGEGLTPEAVARIRAIHGHVISPDNSLEEKFLESAKEKMPLQKSVDLPAKKATTAPKNSELQSHEDPNL